MERPEVFVNDEIMERQAVLCQEIKAMPKKQKTYFVQTFGCQLNEHDSETLAGQLENMGFTPAADWHSADVFVLNTCSVRENADQRFFGHLGRLKEIHAHNPNLLVIVCGCMMKIDEHVDHLKASFPFVDIVFGPQDIYRFPELLSRRLCGSQAIYSIGNEDVIAEGLHVVHERKFRALCTIMFGCNNYCTYCIVPYARGRERSRRPEDIIKEIQELADQGFSEIMLLGQNVNAYGKDLPAISPPFSNNFAALLYRICSETTIPRIRFMTSHPKDISTELLTVMHNFPQIERHLHLPLQSGSDTILKKMNRHYDARNYLSIVDEARKQIEGLSITTDIIVGFPGESEKDFSQTLDVVKEVAFDSAFTFMYSPRYGTPAAVLAEQIPREVMQERFDRLLALQNENALQANKARVGRRDELLIEGRSEHGGRRLTGRGSDFHLVNFNVSELLLAKEGLTHLSIDELGAELEGRFCEVKIEEARTFSLLGDMISLKPKR